MVVFCCSVCCDSLKKNQVQKHYSRCRMSMVSCMDCNQEFWNDDYQQHTKCISEEEKYSGKDYKPKPGQNKGEAKQDAWLQQVQKAIDNSNPSPKLRNLFERLKEYPNIPRKQAKFLNFLRNSIGVHDQKLATSVWEILMPAGGAAQTKDPKTDEANDDNEKENVVDGQCEKNGHVDEDEKVDDDDDDNSEKMKKMSKREKKEERRKEQTKVQKKDKKKQQQETIAAEEESDDRPIKKKGKKRKRNDDDYLEDEEGRKKNEDMGSKKKKKSHKKVLQNSSKNDDDDDLPPLEPNPNHVLADETQEVESGDNEEDNNVRGKKNGLKAKKKKSHKKEIPPPTQEDNDISSLEPNSNHANIEEEEEEDSPPKKKKQQKNKKFNWEQTIIALLKKSKENSMSEKKLRKKVLAEYMDQDGHVDSMSILKAKFDRKIKKNQQLVCQKDRVCLRDE